MFTVVYLANELPSAVEPYVLQEIQELNRNQVEVIACSARKVKSGEIQKLGTNDFVCLQPLRFSVLGNSLIYLIRNFSLIKPLLVRILFEGHEPFRRRAAAILHTWLGG